MVKRRKIGIIYEYDEKWIGGTYYIQNLILALRLLADDEQPELFIFTHSDDSFIKLKNTVGYKRLLRGSYIRRLPMLQQAVNKLSRRLLQKNLFSNLVNDLPVVFPGGTEIRFRKNQQFLYWIPDFQEHYLPGFFSPEEIKNRVTVQKNIVQLGRYIVFSSKAAKKDFNELYPDNGLQQFVMPFAVTHPPLNLSYQSVSKKYKLPETYFICSNQFWRHKDHLVVIQAVNLLKQVGQEWYIVFTGKEYDNGSSAYFDNLKNSIVELELVSNIIFTGFISRDEQLIIMRNAAAVIQSSLFEGWSTVVEDAKSLQVPVIASGIDVHREQLENYNAKLFFTPSDAGSLAESMKQVSQMPEPHYDYDPDIGLYAQSFLQIVNIIEGKN